MLTVESGDEIVVEMATHHACDDYDKMIKGDEGMEDIYLWDSAGRKSEAFRGATGGGDGVHILTGSIFVKGANIFMIDLCLCHEAKMLKNISFCLVPLVSSLQVPNPAISLKLISWTCNHGSIPTRERHLVRMRQRGGDIKREPTKSTERRLQLDPSLERPIKTTK